MHRHFSEGMPGRPRIGTTRMHDPACLKLMTIALTRVHFKALDDLAHGSTYQDTNAALERTISEGCRLIIALK